MNDLKKMKAALSKRLDGQAIGQLRAEVTRLADELEQCQSELAWAQDAADFWQNHAEQLRHAMENGNYATHRSVGITQGGEMLVVSMEEAQ